MIDEEATFKQFGYRSNEIKREQKVVVICGNCSNSRIISKMAALQSKVCSKCQRTAQCEILSKTIRVGWNHSEETKKKIGESNKLSQKKGEQSPNFGRKLTAEHLAKLAKINKERICSVETRQKMSEAKKGRKLSLATRQKMSEIRLAKPTRIGHKASHGKGAYYIAPSGEQLWMRSSWEIKVAKYLDDKDIKWEYEPDAFSITYEINGKTKKGTFRPDFKVITNDSVEYWEVKGWWRDDARVKYDAFTAQYFTLSIKLLEKEKLKEMKIL